MKIMLWGITVLLLASGCSAIDASNHEDYGTSAPASLYIHTEENVAPGDAVPVQIHVLQNEQPYSVQGDVSLTVYDAEQEKIETKRADSSGEGVYTASVRVPDDGVYTFEAELKEHKSELQTAKQVGVGDLTSEEQEMLGGGHESGHSSTHH
ncbi:hypothetical protein [Marinococcus halophilus]|uniref:hypothetical protein n=1 Tax=Marinococcus halophilus TaxID=1371 RepID=UPI0009A87F57|nr:hypothetical protein [Marinococcus halophilus]